VSKPVIEAGSFQALPPKDREVAEKLAARLAAGTAPSLSEIAQAEALFARHRREPMISVLLRSLVLVAADRLTSQRNIPEARQVLERGAALLPNDPDVQRALMRTIFELADWPAAEAIARRVLSTEPSSPDGRTVLALATASQGNDRDALRAIYSALEVVTSGPDEANLRQLRDQIERRLWAVSGCREDQLPDPSRGGESNERLERFLAMVAGCAGGGPAQRLAHFSVGFQRLGDDVVFQRLRIRFASVESVGRDMLALLEPQYSAVALTLDHQMNRPIPVVILQDAEYRAVTGAPVWAGGQFDNEDGTITIPLGLLDRVEFTDPETQREWEATQRNWREKVLIHETAHAFIEDMSGSMAPREIHEGLAQVLEREVTKDRTDLSVALAEGAKTEAARRHPNDTEAQQQFTTAALGRLFQEIRTAGSRHAGTVRSVYLGGELFVEYLVRQRSMGGMRDLLKTMAQERNVDAAFERVYGRSYDGTRRAWLDWLRGQWGVGDVRH
jgi:hypothetical protein